jgi:catechol 2,3-dioxygenase-like lactoylglutathione lyase family enzyme
VCTAYRREGKAHVDWKLELIVVPVSDVDRAKDFYVGGLGWTLIVDHRAGEDFRVVQVLPPGSGCAIALMRNPDAAGSVQGLHLVVSDIVTARAELAGRGVAASDLFHFDDGAQTPGADPERRDYSTFLSFADPDGTGWMVQEVGRKATAAG